MAVAWSYAAVAKTSSMLSMIFGLSGPVDDTSVILSDHMVRRSAALASRKLGAAFLRYQGRGVQVTAVPWVGMYQAQMAA